VQTPESSEYSSITYSTSYNGDLVTSVNAYESRSHGNGDVQSLSYKLPFDWKHPKFPGDEDEDAEPSARPNTDVSDAITDRLCLILPRDFVNRCAD
jgi:hypothetical protein